jgi:glutamate synthase (NADPH/NADH) small chain
MDENKKYPKSSIFKPLRHFKYLFKRPLSHPLDTVLTAKNADYLNKNNPFRKNKLKNSQPRTGPDNLRGFHVNDWEQCIGCATCEEICPTAAIEMVPRHDLPLVAGKLQQRPVIDYGRCCFCALCVDTCTTGSLKMSKEYVFGDSNPNSFKLMPTEKWQDHEVELGYQKSEVTDLLDLKRIEMEHVSPEERVKSYIEVIRGYSKEFAKLEASRCVECGVCTASCPVQMHIPDYIRAIWEDDIEGGLKIIYETNPLPGVCGRVCTHNCETACSIAQRGEAIAIRWLKRYIIDSAPDEMYEKIFSEPVSEVINAKIAIAGSGPSSLSAAYYLRGLGYTVDVFEEKSRAGGVASFGAPEYRIPDYAVEKDINFIKKIGVNIYTNTKIGKDITLEELQKKYDAVYLGTGFFSARKLNIPGSDHPDVMGAMDFLPITRDFARGAISLEDVNVKPSVVVVGGGDVAFDVARNATRIQILKYGKANVKLTSLETLDILPGSDDEYLEGTEEYINCFLGHGPQEVVLKDGKIKGLRVTKCTRVFDETGRFNPEFDNTQETLLEGEQVFFSVGQAPDYSYIPESLKDKVIIERGKIKASQDGQVAGLDWLFVGGDIFRGPDIITGVSDGHRAAVAIDDFLYNKSKKKEQTEYMKNVREAIKFNNPDLALKPERKRTLK